MYSQVKKELGIAHIKAERSSVKREILKLLDSPKTRQEINYALRNYSPATIKSALLELEGVKCERKDGSNKWLYMKVS